MGKGGRRVGKKGRAENGKNLHSIVSLYARREKKAKAKKKKINMGRRGQGKHMKRINAPKHLMLDKLGGIFVRCCGCLRAGAGGGNGEAAAGPAAGGARARSARGLQDAPAGSLGKPAALAPLNGLVIAAQ